MCRIEQPSQRNGSGPLGVWRTFELVSCFIVAAITLFIAVRFIRNAPQPPHLSGHPRRRAGTVARGLTVTLGV